MTPPEPIRSLAEVEAMLEYYLATWGDRDELEPADIEATLATLAAVRPLLEDLQEADDQLRADGVGSGFSAACTDEARATLDQLLAPARGEGEAT